MGSGSQVLNYRLGCLAQRLTVYTVATVNSHLPIALDTQPANLCMRGMDLIYISLLLKFDRI